MKLALKRMHYFEKCTIGRLFVDGVDLLYTLEDTVRLEKIAGRTAIPVGDYKVIFDYSNRFKRVLPHILDVPNFTGIRIHPGNTDADTCGCVLVGLDWDGGDFIGRSDLAFEQLVQKINGAPDLEIEIS